jgi:hypothetical protein
MMLLATACTNGFSEFYRPAESLNGVGLLPLSREPQVRQAGQDVQADIRHLFEDGYWLVGESNFSGPPEDLKGAVAQAKKIQAAIVLVKSRYQSTRSWVMPLSTPSTSTSYSSGSVNAFGSGGSAFGTYSGSTTTYGTQTTYVPYSVDRYDQLALYFAELPRSGLGVMFEDLNEAQRRQIQSNRGLAVIAVRRGSPAYQADLLSGDLIVEVNGIQVDRSNYRSAFERYGGAAAEFVLVRGDRRITKQISVPSRW